MIARDTIEQHNNTLSKIYVIPGGRLWIFFVDQAVSARSSRSAVRSISRWPGAPYFDAVFSGRTGSVGM
jgi:hypothetical protein